MTPTRTHSSIVSKLVVLNDGEQRISAHRRLSADRLNRLAFPDVA